MMNEEKQVPKCPECWMPISIVYSTKGTEYHCPNNHEIDRPVYGVPPKEEYEALDKNLGIRPIQGSTRNPWLNKVLSQIATLHDKKNHDYCPDDNNPFFNFERSVKYAMCHVASNLSPIDAFNILLGTKAARLYALSERGGTPNNEAFVDSEWDYVVYFLLRESYKLKLKEEFKK